MDPRGLANEANINASVAALRERERSSSSSEVVP
jgi:hypothetical protein